MKHAQDMPKYDNGLVVVRALPITDINLRDTTPLDRLQMNFDPHVSMGFGEDWFRWFCPNDSAEEKAFVSGDLEVGDYFVVHEEPLYGAVPVTEYMKPDAFAAKCKPLSPMPEYRCHKVVRALQIKEFMLFTPAGSPDRALEETKKVQVMHLVFDGYPNIAVTDEWMGKHQPHPGGYFVVYEDGYASYSPCAAFEAGYALIPADG